MGSCACQTINHVVCDAQQLSCDVNMPFGCYNRARWIDMGTCAANGPVTGERGFWLAWKVSRKLLFFQLTRRHVSQFNDLCSFCGVFLYPDKGNVAETTNFIAELPLAVRPAGEASIPIKACPSFFMVMASGMPRGRMCSTCDVAQHPGYGIFFHGVRDRVWLINDLIIIFAVLHIWCLG